MRGILQMHLPERPGLSMPDGPWSEIEDLSKKKEEIGLKSANHLQPGRDWAGTPAKSTIFSDGQSF
jgi:hypothetical protein